MFVKVIFSFEFKTFTDKMTFSFAITASKRDPIPEEPAKRPGPDLEPPCGEDWELVEDRDSKTLLL